ncbi:hypothetical protein CTI14_57320, partial [Methylobacterium radiotolerans]
MLGIGCCTRRASEDWSSPRLFPDVRSIDETKAIATMKVISAMTAPTAPRMMPAIDSPLPSSFFTSAMIPHTIA